MKFKKNDNKGKIAAGLGGAVIGAAAATAAMVATDKQKREKVQANMKQMKADAEKQITDMKKKYLDHKNTSKKLQKEEPKPEKSEDQTDSPEIARM